ncbi:MAG TPA: nuclear transport factor 2 family protein [Casimicrobiaceae bacterium]|jgi:ketosteroid isomerase-like protein
MAKVRTPTIFTTPQDAATAFYRAFEAKDIDAMMAAWAEDEEIVCVHPGGPRLVGFDAVRVGWEQIFSGETKLLFRLEELVVLETVGMALQSAIEQVTVGDNPTPRGTAIASNVFLRTPSGWRIVLHHASPAPTMTIASPAGPLH